MYDPDPRIGLGTCADHGHGRVTTGPDNTSGGHSSESRTFPTNSSHRRVLISPPYRPRGRSPTSIRLCAHANDAHIGLSFRATLSSISFFFFFWSLPYTLRDGGWNSTEGRSIVPVFGQLTFPADEPSGSDRLRCYPNRANHPTHNRFLARFCFCLRAETGVQFNHIIELAKAIPAVLLSG